MLILKKYKLFYFIILLTIIYNCKCFSQNYKYFNFVYTAFDGDDIMYIDSMRDFSIKHNYIPLNPEHILGYYISTTYYNNFKKEVMKDCLSIIDNADEFWIFSKYDKFDISLLSEGVIIEIIHFANLNNTDKIKIKFINLNKAINYLTNDIYYLGDIVEININSILSQLSPIYKKDILNYYKQFSKNRRKLVFIDLNNNDIKYSDWIRLFIFKKKLIPFIPQLTISQINFEKYNINKYNIILTNIINKLKHIYSFKKKFNNCYDFNNNINNELFIKNNIIINQILLKNTNIPKYKNPKKWSITRDEINQNLK